MNGEIATFMLSSFYEFVETYKANNDLATEAIDAFDHFIPTLDRFFDFLEDFNEINNATIFIKWYNSAVISSSDTIRANSNWYHQAVFDNISINMNSNEIENYVTNDGMCFGKVNFYLTISTVNNDNDNNNIIILFYI